MKSNRRLRGVRAALVVTFVALLATILPAAPATAAPVDFPFGVTLQGTCTNDTRAIALPLGGSANVWSPYLVYFPDRRVSKFRLLVPYELRFSGSGAGLKTRHFLPGGEFNAIRTPPPRATLIKCRFSTDYLDAGQPAHVDADINGVLLPN